MDEPTQKFLQEALEYRDGVLYWKLRPLTHFPDVRARNIWNTKFAGKRAGTLRKQYEVIGVIGKQWLTHRLVYIMHNGQAPKYLDHIDGDKRNNRIENLRPCTPQNNAHNQKVHIKNTTGIKGVTKLGNRFRVKIWVNYRQIHLGVFDDLELAELVSIEARNKYHGEFARVR